MEQENGFIGDIKYSILEPGVFEEIHPNWKLLKGQTIEIDSGLGKLGITQLPDARGIFLRGMNENQDITKGDSDGNRPIGSYQKDELEKHNHEMNFNLGTQPGWAGGWGGVAGIHPANSPGDAGWDHHPNPTGGNETRPRNIAVYIYIKIN